jgi:hypothetical protein
MANEEPKVRITLRQIAKSGCWAIFCQEYGVNEWCLNEGADENAEYEISLKDASEWLLNK